jgi:hypothetical protein
VWGSSLSQDSGISNHRNFGFGRTPVPSWALHATAHALRCKQTNSQGISAANPRVAQMIANLVC